MRTMKCKCYVYDVKKRKGEWVEKELPVYNPPKPTPSPEQVTLKNLIESISTFITELKTATSSATTLDELKTAIAKACDDFETNAKNKALSSYPAIFKEQFKL